ncbi:TPA: hypothetical protein HA239_01565 [Candidatus Woesearchaeota archaeon]|nr:hypothetical protein [Candidatus Woesearchaeota archaeon]HIH41081.1 hypothetical protein [Candidatus Woesearchaeota archaeon]
MKQKILLPAAFILMVQQARAHCPLCTIGAAAAAGGAAWLGVNQGVIGLFIGAFAVSMGWWFSNLIKRQYVKYQRAVLILLSYITTVLPMLNIMEAPLPVFVFIAGNYGSLLNRTYVINLFLLGSLIGAAIVSVTPYLSRKITEARKKTIPFQGMIMTFVLLILSGLIINVVV